MRNDILPIGEFYNPEGYFRLSDTLMCPLTSDYMQITIDDQVVLYYRNCIESLYKAVYILNDDYRPTELLVYSDRYPLEFYLDRLNMFREETELPLSCSRTFALYQPDHFGDARSCYYEIEEDALYNSYDLLDHLSACPYSSGEKETLKIILRNSAEKIGYITGKELLKTVKDYAPWKGYKDSSVTSTHWGCEMERQVKNGLPYYITKYGIIGNAGDSWTKVSLLRNGARVICAFRFSVNLASIRKGYSVYSTINRNRPNFFVV